MSSRGRRPSQSTRSSSSRSASSSKGARPSARRATAEPAPRRRSIRKKSSVGPAIAASAVLGVLAIILFVVIRSQQSDRKLEEKLAEIEARAEEAETEIDPYAAGEAVASALAMNEAQAEAKRRAEEKPSRPARPVKSYDVRQLPHLEETPEALRAEIDAAIKTLVQLDDHHASDEARGDVLRIGRPAVPRLLNRFVGLEMDREEHILRANILHRTLSEMVRLPDGEEIGFVPQEETTPRFVEARRHSIRRWFRWWADEGDSFE